MPNQFHEYYHKRTGLSVGVEQKLYSETSAYQNIEILETDTWGRMMTIDGMVMLSEKDEFVYHEMLTHVGLFAHPKPERILIIGGGDGGTAREVMVHPSVKQVDMVEIDEVVIEASKKFLPEVGDWQNLKLNVVIDDGLKFVKNKDRLYDMIIVDGSDPVGPAKGLFGEAFLQDCYEGLNENGILISQTESPWVEHYHKSIQRVFSIQRNLFKVSKMYLAYIPLYPAGMWSFSYASKGLEPLTESTIRRVSQGLKKMDLKYYNAAIHRGCFALPDFVANIIE